MFIKFITLEVIDVSKLRSADVRFDIIATERIYESLRKNNFLILRIHSNNYQLRQRN